MAALHNDHEQLREGALLAAERRAHEAPSMNVKQLAHIHDLKQNFRRLIDPGIMRPNNKETALLALKVKRLPVIDLGFKWWAYREIDSGNAFRQPPPRT